MKKTPVAFNIGTVPFSIRRYIVNSSIYDSSCSDHTKTLFIDGEIKGYLKISKKGSLEREGIMTRFLNGFSVAPHVIAYESDFYNDFLLAESVDGEDGAERVHIRHPQKLAHVFGEYLKMLHSLPAEGCPFPGRTLEIVSEVYDREISQDVVDKLVASAIDDVIIHGDYCLPNIVMDNFRFKGFIDLGSGGIGAIVDERVQFVAMDGGIFIEER